MTHLLSLIASPSDRENIVVEIWCGPVQVAEVSHEPDQPVEIEIYPSLDGEKWRFELQELLILLEHALVTLGQSR